MTDYLEEQKNEIEALESIYSDEFTIVSEKPSCFQVKLIPEVHPTHDDGEEPTPASCSLQFTYVDKYPDDVPIIEVVDTENMTDDDVNILLESLMQEASENLGMVMVFTLVSSALEKLNVFNEDTVRRRVEAKEKKLRAEEEAERKRFEGTRVTIESFLAWKADFDAEVTDAKMKRTREKSAIEGKLTGRQLFERDESLIESDLQFLEEGDQDIKVDESLFQDLDDLDLDEEVSD